MSFQFTQFYGSSAEFTYPSTAISIVQSSVGTTGYATLLNPTISPPPFLTTQTLFQATSCTSFWESKSTTGADAIQYTLQANGQQYFYNTTASMWQKSNGTYSQSTSGSVLSGNLSTFFSQLGFNGAANMQVIPFLYSAGSTVPQLKATSIGYNLTLPVSTVVPQCQVFAYLANLAGNLVVPTSSQPAILWAGSDRGYFYGSNYIEPFATSAAFNQAGYAQVTVGETTTPGKEVQFWITYYESKSLKCVKFLSCLVPNMGSVALSQITSIKRADFG